jgi:hypothetical protein
MCCTCHAEVASPNLTLFTIKADTYLGVGFLFNPCGPAHPADEGDVHEGSRNAPGRLPFLFSIRTMQPRTESAHGRTKRGDGRADSRQSRAPRARGRDGVWPTRQVFLSYWNQNLTCTSACTAICPKLISPPSLAVEHCWADSASHSACAIPQGIRSPRTSPPLSTAAASIAQLNFLNDWGCCQLARSIAQ